MGDVVKDDSGSYAVFTDHGFSASHMTAAQVVDVISRWLDCAGEASDTVSVHTQVEMEDLPKSECPTGKIRLPRSRCPKSWVKRQDPVVPLGIFFGDPFGRIAVGATIRKHLTRRKLGERTVCEHKS